MRFESSLSNWFEAFLVHRSGCQMKISGWYCELRRLDRIAAQHQVNSPSELTPSMVEHFLTENRPSPRTRNTRLSKLRVFQRFLTPRGANLNLNATLAVKAPPFRPHIYSLCEIGSILRLLRRRGAARRRFRWLGIETIVFLLYSCGLRLREPLHLKFRDVDFTRATLFLDCTKFYKQRFVPLGRIAARRLKVYLRARKTAFPELAGPDDPLFVTDYGRRFQRGKVEYEFASVVSD